MHNARLAAAPALRQFVADKLDCIVHNREPLSPALLEQLLHLDQPWPAPAAAPPPAGAAGSSSGAAAADPRAAAAAAAAAAAEGVFGLRVALSCPKLGVALSMRSPAAVPAPEAADARPAYVQLTLQAISAELEPSGGWHLGLRQGCVRGVHVWLVVGVGVGVGWGWGWGDRGGAKEAGPLDEWSLGGVEQGNAEPSFSRHGPGPHLRRPAATLAAARLLAGRLSACVDRLACGPCDSPVGPVPTHTKILSAPSSVCRSVCRAADFFQYAVHGTIAEGGAQPAAGAQLKGGACVWAGCRSCQALLYLLAL